MTDDILKLFEKEFIKKLFEAKFRRLYPEFAKIKKIEIKPIKKMIWDNYYHIVIGYAVSYSTKEGKRKKIPVYCSGHGSEPRKNVYLGLKFLWKNGFGRSRLTIPRPLWYSIRYNAVFYRGARGENLLHFINEKNEKEMERIISLAADWLAKLHALPAGKAINFNLKNSRIATIIPGSRYITEEIKNRYGSELYEIFVKIYDGFIKREREFLSPSGKRWVVHGDVHPENVVKISSRKIAFIDFTDLCLADFARDLGSFLQQLEYKMSRREYEPEKINRIKNIFLEEYEKKRGTLTEEEKKRIEMYRFWTAFRTAIFHLLKHDPQPERAMPLIEEIKKYFSF